MTARQKFETRFSRPFVLENSIDAELSSQEVVYEFTNNEFYLKQYDALVRTFYKKDLDLDIDENNMQGGIVDHAEYEHMYIVRQGDKVVGGAKLSFAFLNSAITLPMEEADFSVRSYLPENYTSPSYCEIGRLVVDPGFRGKEVLSVMIAKLMSYAASQQCGYMFVIAPALNAVLYRRVCRSIGIKIEVEKNAVLPEKELYKKLGLKLLSCDLRHQYEAVPQQHAAG